MAALCALEALVDEARNPLAEPFAERRRLGLGQIARRDLGIQLFAHPLDQCVDHGLRLNAVALGDLGQGVAGRQRLHQRLAVAADQLRHAVAVLGVQSGVPARAVMAIAVAAGVALVRAAINPGRNLLGDLAAVFVRLRCGQLAVGDGLVEFRADRRDDPVDHGLLLNAVGGGDFGQRLTVGHRGLERGAVGHADQLRHLRAVVVVPAPSVAVAIPFAIAALRGDHAHHRNRHSDRGDRRPEPAPLPRKPTSQASSQVSHHPAPSAAGRLHTARINRMRPPCKRRTRRVLADREVRVISRPSRPAVQGISGS